MISGSSVFDRNELYKKFEMFINNQIENVEMLWAALDLLTESELIKLSYLMTKNGWLNELDKNNFLNLPIRINDIEKFVALIRGQL